MKPGILDSIVEMFTFRWETFNWRGGLIYILALLPAWYLMHLLDQPVFVAALSALMAAITNIPGKLRVRIQGMFVFTLLSICIAVLAFPLGLNLWANAISLFVISFCGFFAMAFGLRALVVGWVLILWAILVPLFLASDDLLNIIFGLMIGAAIVMTVTAVTEQFSDTEIYEKDTGDDHQISDPGSTQSRRDVIREHLSWNSHVLRYALFSALAMSLATIIGWTWVETDPSWVANSVLMIIGPDHRTTWLKGIQRGIGTILGVLAGFWIIQAVDSFTLIVALTTIVSFLCLALLEVNYGAMVFFWTIFMVFGFGLKGLDTVDFSSNERIAAEFVGIPIAVIAVFLSEKSVGWRNRTIVGKKRILKQE